MRKFTPGLGYHILTPLYGWAVRATMPELEFKRLLLDQAAIEAGFRVADIGCGTGVLARMAKERCSDSQVTGYDVDPRMLSRAAANASSGEIPWVLAEPGRPLPIPNASVDRVFSSLVFHHLTNDEKAFLLSDIRRVLAPNGALHLADWVQPRTIVERTGFLGIRLLDGFAVTKAHAEGRLQQIVRDAGFSEIRETGEFSTILGRLGLFRAC